MFGFAKKTDFPQSQLIPLIIKLGEYLKYGYEHAQEIEAKGTVIDPDILSIFIDSQMKEWNPKINEKNVLDESTRKAASRFLAGIATNIIRK